jgi:hypothetical protein
MQDDQNRGQGLGEGFAGSGRERSCVQSAGLVQRGFGVRFDRMKRHRFVFAFQPIKPASFLMHA